MPDPRVDYTRSWQSHNLLAQVDNTYHQTVTDFPDGAQSANRPGVFYLRKPLGQLVRLLTRQREME